MRIHLARPEEAVHLWPQVERALAGTFDLVKDTHYPTDVLAAILTGQMFLFVALDGEEVKGACVAHFTLYPRMKALTEFLVGGKDMPSWIGAMEEATEGFARASGCARCEAGGRAGWAGVTRYRKVGVMLRKDL